MLPSFASGDFAMPEKETTTLVVRIFPARLSPVGNEVLLMRFENRLPVEAWISARVELRDSNGLNSHAEARILEMGPFSLDGRSPLSSDPAVQFVIAETSAIRAHAKAEWTVEPNHAAAAQGGGTSSQLKVVVEVQYEPSTVLQ